MSEQNIEIVRGIYDGWARGDFAAATRHYHEGTVLVMRPEFPEAGTYRGLEGIRGYMKGFLAAFDRVTIDAENLVGEGDGVVADVHQVATGKGSGATVEMRYCQAWILREGRVDRFESIQDRADALAAAGLSRG
jgi:ketosteroid isomerase-like protein